MAADFNGDGHADLGVVGDESDNLFVLLGQGGGAFSALAGSPFALGDGPSFAAVADFSGDGRPDVATANFRSSVSVMIQQPNGTFAPQAGSPIAAPGPAAVGAADFDGDGRPDLAIALWNPATVRVLHNTGTGFTLEADTQWVRPARIAIADFNGDNRPTWRCRTGGPARSRSCWRMAAGGFDATTLSGGAEPSGVATGDFNRDGRTDFAVISQVDNTLSVYSRRVTNDGSGGPAQRHAERADRHRGGRRRRRWDARARGGQRDGQLGVDRPPRCDRLGGVRRADLPRRRRL